jgi:hypothetical protein
VGARWGEGANILQSASCVAERGCIFIFATCSLHSRISFKLSKYHARDKLSGGELHRVSPEGDYLSGVGWVSPEELTMALLLLAMQDIFGVLKLRGESGTATPLVKQIARIALTTYRGNDLALSAPISSRSAGCEIVEPVQSDRIFDIPQSNCGDP